MHWRECEQYGHALVDIDDDGAPMTLRLPWDHRAHWVGWGRRPRVHWTSHDGRECCGLEATRGRSGIIVYDEHGQKHVLPEGAYRVGQPALTPMAKGRHPAPPPGSRWITVHPHGPGSKGQAILVTPAGDGTHRVIGGAGGSLNHLRLDKVKSPEEHAKAAKERAAKKRAEKKAASEKLTKEERAAERAAKKEKRAARRRQQRKVIEHVRDKLGGVSPDLTDEELAEEPASVQDRLLNKHHRKQWREAMKRREEVVKQLSERRAAQLAAQDAVEDAIAEGADGWTEAGEAATRELELIAQEDEERAARRNPRTRTASADAQKAAETAAAHLEAVDLSATMAELVEEKPATLTASYEMKKRSAEHLREAKILHDAATKGPPEDPEAAAREWEATKAAMKRAGLDMDGDPDEVREALAQEAAILLRRAQAADLQAQKYAAMEAAGDGEKALKQKTGRDLQRELSEQVSEAAERLGLRERDKTPLREAEAAELVAVLADIETLRKMDADLEDCVKASQGPEWDRSRRAFDLGVGEPADAVVQEIEQRMLTDLAHQLNGIADNKNAAHMRAVADGHFHQMADVSLAVGNTTYIDRTVIDALGMRNASHLLRHAMELDGHTAEDMEAVLTKHHLRTQRAISERALDEAEAFLPGLRETVNDVDDIEAALATLDGMDADLDAAQKAVGAALGQMEATATMAQAFRGEAPEQLTIPGKEGDLGSQLTWLASVGLGPSDYAIDPNTRDISIPRESWAKLIRKDSAETIEQRKTALAIKRGDHDEDGWLPEGMVSRDAGTFQHRDPKRPRYWEAVDLAHEDLPGELRRHIGARLASGETPADIEADLKGETLAQKAPDPNAYREMVAEMFPRHLPEDHAQMARNEEIRAEQRRLQDAYGAAEAAGDTDAMESALAELGALDKPQAVRKRQWHEMDEHYHGIASDYMAEHHPDAHNLHSASLYDHAPREQLNEAAWRTLAARPEARAAFKPVEDLEHADRQALQSYLLQKLGLSDNTWSEEATKHAEEVIATLNESAASRVQPAMGGFFAAGGPTATSSQEAITLDNLHTEAPDQAKRLANLYPRELGHLHAAAMGERPADHTGPRRYENDPAHAAILEHIERNPGANAHEITKAVQRKLGRLAAAEKAGMSPEHYSMLRARSRLLVTKGANAREATDAAAAEHGLTGEMVRQAATQVARLETQAVALEPRLSGQTVSTEYAAEMWDSETAAFQRQKGRASTPWAQYVMMHGDRGNAYQSLQDELRGEVVGSFRDHFGAVTDGAELGSAIAPIRNQDLHEAGMQTPRQRAALQEQLREEMERSRGRAAAGELDASGAKAGGRFVGGSARGSLVQGREENRSEAQQQGLLGLGGGGGMFPPPSAPPEQGGMFAQAGLAFGAPPPPPKRVVLQDPATPRDPGNLERHALGDRAESELGDLLTQLGTQFDPRKGTGPNESDRYKAGNLFAGASMDGERIDQQRLLKLMRHTGYRAAGFLGTGAGKTATSIGSFADAHSQGVASHGLFLVPLAVQDQFDGAMQEFTAPGRYRWQAGGKDHNDRVSALRNQDTHVRVQTHQSFAQDQMKLMADHHGISTEAMAARFRRQSPAERAQTLRAVHDAVGIPMHHVYVDEGHMLTTRKGEEESLQAMVIKAASHPTNATGYLNGTATPGKNDLHELLGLAADVQPDQYSDRHRLLNNYANEGTMAAPDALRRELDHMTYTARVDPPTDRISVSNPMIGEDGKVTSRKHLELSAEHAAHVAEADAAFKAARLAHRAGGVDVEACKRLNPRRFEGVPEEQHEDLAREMGPALGLIRAHAQRRAINQAPPEINTKVQAMLSVLQHDTQAGKQSIIFTDSREEAEMLHRYLSQQGLATGLYHGGHTQEARANFRRDFKGGHLRIAIMTSAGEAGIHLPEATAVHHYDIAKTAKSHTQRTGRAHRQGQTKDVHVYDWTTDTEHDARALATLQKKHRLASVAETPLGPMDEHGFAADYHEHITAKHASTDIVSLAAK